MIYVLVPDGLSIDNKENIIPSFVFRSVINYTNELVKDGDEVYFAPANDFGLGISEQIAGLKFLINNYPKKSNVNYYAHQLFSKNYVDTFGNAKYLKKQYPHIMNSKIDLVCSYIHSKRAEYCFLKLGYNINRIHRVTYKIVDEKIVNRLFYYKYKYIHIVYEFFARLFYKLKFG